MKIDFLILQFQIQQLMDTIKAEVLIIGGGLTGLTLAYLLQEKGIHCNVVEARNRLGGRIFTESYESSQPLEMGATWLGKKHLYLQKPNVILMTAKR